LPSDLNARSRRWLLPALVAVLGSAIMMGVALGTKRGPGDDLLWNRASQDLRAVLWPEPRPLGDDFVLTDQQGRQFSAADFRGQWDLVLFGFLACPDVCPTSLRAMREIKGLLVDRVSGPDQPRFIFISVDPENDQPDAIGQYLAWFDTQFLGLTGQMSEVRRVADHMAVYFEEVRDGQGYRSIDHSSSLIVIDPHGRVVGAMQPPLLPERLAEQFVKVQDFFASI